MRAWQYWMAVVVIASCDSGPSTEVCSGGEDEDQDTLIDCDDDDCWVASGSCSEACDTVFDEDGDGMDGCEDPDCWIEGGICPEECDEEGDEDGDGAAECADSDCWVAPSRCDEVCDAGGNDEDGDGAVDCDDDDCWRPDSGCSELCEGGNDEDGDGTVDCDDSDCDTAMVCIPTFLRDTQPILLEHCAGYMGMCHTDLMPLGGLSFDSYDDMTLPSLYCNGMNKAQCSLFRILEPTMPMDCLGCVPQPDIDVIQEWVDAGDPRRHAAVNGSPPAALGPDHHSLNGAAGPDGCEGSDDSDTRGRVAFRRYQLGC